MCSRDKALRSVCCFHVTSRTTNFKPFFDIYTCVVVYVCHVQVTFNMWDLNQMYWSESGVSSI